MKLLVTGSRAMPYRVEVMNALSEWFISLDDDPKITLIYGGCQHPPLEKYEVPPNNRYLPTYKPRSLWSVDALALETAGRFDWDHEEYGADWYNSCDNRCYHAKYINNFCPAAGPRRNKIMVDQLDPETDQVLAFPYGKSAGTRGCIKLAERAGLDVIVYEL